MTKFLTSLAALAMTAGLAVAPAAAAPNSSMYHVHCPRGTYWVAPHRNRMGHWVRGHCARR